MRFELAEGIAQVERSAWNALVGDESPFLEWEWLASLEAAGCLGETKGWLPRPLLARDDSGLAAAIPLYVKGHSEGEFVFDFAWADAAHRAGISYYPKLLAGVPFTPVGGARILTRPGLVRSRWITGCANFLREICERNELSGVHANFCRVDEFEALREAGWLPRLGLQYHWMNRGYASFDEYLGELRSKRRNQVRRELRSIAAEGIEVETRVGDEIPDAWFGPMYRFYRHTIDHNPWGRPYLNEKLFELLAERFRSRLCFVVARRGDTLIGGAFNVQKGDALYGRYWGAIEPVRNLHFAVCYYAGIEHCIRTGLERFEPGAGGSYKQLRGFDAHPTRSAHYLSDPRLAEAVARYLDGERSETREAIDWYRERSALKAAADDARVGRERLEPAAGEELP
jgi:predicted N-acyltransferase